MEFIAVDFSVSGGSAAWNRSNERIVRSLCFRALINSGIGRIVAVSHAQIMDTNETNASSRNNPDILVPT